MSVQYRPEIDGLRAIAVGSVIAYHAGGYVPGGFVGVDIFFVISGYLITTLIRSDLEKGKFSFFTFYERRASRIFPIFFLVLATASLIAQSIMLPSELLDFARTLLWSIPFLANVGLYIHDSYFAPSSELTPLLHIWSLGVEEQFYIVLPVVVWATSRMKAARVAAVLSACWLASLAATQFSLGHDPMAAFYLPHLRAWELLTGSLLSMMPLAESRTKRNVLALAGAGLIFASLTMINKKLPFPGLVALAPCLGAALVICSIGKAPLLLHWFLRTAPMVAIGRISYGLYLWHWPILSLAKVYLSRSLNELETIAAILLSIILATLTYFTVEQPIRNRLRWRNAWVVLSLSAIAMIGLSIEGAHLFAEGRGGFGLSAEQKRLISSVGKAPDEIYRSGTCFLDRGHDETVFKAEMCVPSSPRPKLALWGDSFAAHYYPGLREAFPTLAIQQLTASACPPIIGNTYNWHPRCQQIRSVFVEKIEKEKPEIIVISTTWNGFLHDQENINKTIETMTSQGSHVILLGMGPYYEKRALDLSLRLANNGKDSEWIGTEYLIAGILKTDAALKKSLPKDNPRFSYISMIDLLCEQDVRCRLLTPEQAMLFVDNGHMSEAGSIYVASLLRPRIQAILAGIR